jgi:hypothetical protein
MKDQYAREKIDCLYQSMNYLLKINPVKKDDKYCEICGCHIKDEFAVKGKEEIRERDVRYHPEQQVFWLYTPREKYIYTPYYCKVHAPKDETKKGG